jgi:hypothetical protein
MVEVELVGSSDDIFLTVAETLTRIGIPSNRDKKLYQSCHILHKKGRYFIAHFKEMFMLDGNVSDLSADDLGRRNFICKLLQDWNLIKIVTTDNSKYPMSDPLCVKILKHSDKKDWTVVKKYAIGVKK